MATNVFGNDQTAKYYASLQTFANNISFGGAQVNISGLTAGNALMFDGTNWSNHYVSEYPIGPQVLITSDGYNMASAPAQTRYFVFNHQNVSSPVNWNTYLPDPGASSTTWRYREIVIVNANRDNTSAVNLTINQNSGGTNTKRIIVGTSSSGGGNGDGLVSVDLFPGCSIIFYSTMINTGGGNRWVWHQLTNTIVANGS